jgi:hypothetical protein
MALGNIAHDMKAETHPVGVPRPRFASTERWLEHPATILLGDARAIVNHVERPATAIAAQRDGDMTAGSVVSNRVLNEIAKRLFQECEVALNLDRALRHRDFERYLPSACDWPVPIDDALDEAIQVDRVSVRQAFRRF